MAPVALAGDYNGDGMVDNIDYVVWRKSMNQSVPPFSGADGDGDGVIDQDDYDVWRANFGSSAAAATGTAAALTVTDAGSNVVPAESLPIVVTPAFRQSDVVAAASDVGSSSEQVLFRRSSRPAGEATAAHRPAPRSAFDPRRVASARANDAALLALVSARAADRGATDAAETVWAGCDSADASNASSCDTLDLAFATLGSFALRG
jgi:hypothetical protein